MNVKQSKKAEKKEEKTKGTKKSIKDTYQRSTGTHQPQ